MYFQAASKHDVRHICAISFEFEFQNKLSIQETINILKIDEHEATDVSTYAAAIHINVSPRGFFLSC